MRHGLRAWMLALLLVLPGAGMAEPAQKGPSGPPVPLLWKVSQGGNTLYLLGSFHLLRPDDYPLSADVQQAFDQADALLFEVPPDQLQSPQLAARMLQAATLPPGRRLQDLLPAATWARLQAWAGGNGLDAAQFQPLEAWMVALTVGQVEMARQGLDPQLGLDLHFMQAGQRAGKAGGGLETAQDQIDLLDGMAVEEQVQLLEESLEDAGSAGQSESRRLHAAWRAGDLHVLGDELAGEMKRAYPALYQRIDVDRNDRWLPQLEARLRAPGHHATLVVVGSLHLLGSDGVVEKLRAKGFAVERICSACQAGARP